jgi:sporulation protein YlmC with PRC-barrel domain
MRKISMAAVSALALLTTSAYAQQSPSADSTPRTSTTPAYSPAAAPKAPAENPLKQEDVSKIEGTSVVDNDGKKIGDVSRVLMKPEDKKIDRLVVRAGGIFGAAAFKLDKTGYDLKSMVEWRESGTAAAATGSSPPPEKMTLR